jgi:hypothetical protein
LALKGFWEISFTTVVGDVVMVVFWEDGDVTLRRVRSTLKRTGVESVFWVGKDLPPQELSQKLEGFRQYAGVWNPKFSPDDRFVAAYALVTELPDVYKLKKMGWRLRMAYKVWELAGRPLGVEVVGDTFPPKIYEEDGVTYRRFWF